MAGPVVFLFYEKLKNQKTTTGATKMAGPVVFFAKEKLKNDWNDQQWKAQRIVFYFFMSFMSCHERSG